jgi:hypothetical protein
MRTILTEIGMSRRVVIGAIIGSSVLGIAALAGIADYAVLRDDDDDDDDEGDRRAVARAMTFAKVSLQQGLTASELEGLPISAKFQVDRGNFQLSVYTSNAGRFSEVLVDYSTGDIAKVQPITEGDDLAAARSQSAAMANAKASLRQVVENAVSQAPTSRAISVVPGLRDGRAIASVVLLLKEEEEFRVTHQDLE